MRAVRLERRERSAQCGASIAATHRLLEHSRAQLTNEVYTNVDPVLHQAINLLPVAEWL
jgi:hypothetical protein